MTFLVKCAIIKDEDYPSILKGVIKLRTHDFLRREAANVICWSRILASLALCFLPPTGWGCAALCSLALLSDLWDGWCYRRYRGEHPVHWFNRLPISMDPLADFAFVGGCFIHVAHNKIAGLVYLGLAALVLILWQVIARCAKDLVYTIMMTGLTYYWFGMMVAAMIIVWRRNVQEYWLPGAMMTLVVFYGCYFKLEEKSRRIRKRG